MLRSIAMGFFLLRLGRGAPTESQGSPQFSTPAAGHHEPYALFEHYAQEGAGLMMVMREDQEECLEMHHSPFTIDDMRNKNVGGWVHQNNGQDLLKVLKTAFPELEGLVGVQGLMSAKSGMLWSKQLWIDEYMALVLPHGKVRYRNLMSESNEIIISVLSDSASIAIPDPVAEDTRKETTIRRWSDVTFFQYGSAMDSGEFGKTSRDFLKPVPEGQQSVHKRGAPTWFLQHDIGVATDLSQTVDYCLGTHHKWKLSAWPGVTFPIGSTCFLALLGTATGAEVSMFLIRYRMVIGRGLLGSVTVFKDKAGKTNLLWWAVYDDAYVEMIWPGMSTKNSESDAAACEADTPVGAFPYPLNPVGYQGRR